MEALATKQNKQSTTWSLSSFTQDILLDLFLSEPLPKGEGMTSIKEGN